MLLIAGVDGVLWALAAWLPEGVGSALRSQLGHVPWQGLSMYDLIFPLFVFISGVAMHVSLEKAAERGRSRSRSVALLVRRAVLLVVMGWLVNRVEQPALPLRYASVLGLIGLSCALAGGVALLLRRAWQRVGVALVLLLGVGLAQAFGGDMSPSGCVNGRVDALLCPGRLYLGVLDPEGPLCIVSATALCLAGMAAGSLLAACRGVARSALLLVGVGGCLVALGLLCGPIIKNIWTPAFVVVAAGVNFVLLGVFRLLFDTPRGAVWALPLRVVGANALFCYMLTHAIPLLSIVRHSSALQSVFTRLPEALAPLASALFVPVVVWLLCLYLWRRRLFLKV